MKGHIYILISHWTVLVMMANAKSDQIFEEQMMEPTDRVKWVDPLDMAYEESSDENSKDEIEHLLSECTTKLIDCQDSLKQVNSPEDIFFSRHAKLVFNQIEPFSQSDNGVHIKFEIRLSEKQLNLLREYSENEVVPMVDIDEILSTYIVGVEQFDKESWMNTIQPLVNYFNDPMVAVIFFVILLHILLAVMKFFTLWKLLVILMVVSVMWHWIRLYKIQWASRHAILLSSGSIPPECDPQNMSWTQSLSYTLGSFFTTVDRCQEYHEALMVDPLFEVNPLTAAVDLATNLLLHPLSRFGGESGAMFSSLLAPVPLFWKAPVLLSFLMLLVLLMLLLAGYRVRLPMLFGVLEPSHPNQKNIQEELKEIKKTLQDLKEGKNTKDDVKKFLRLTCGYCHQDNNQIR